MSFSSLISFYLNPGISRDSGKFYLVTPGYWKASTMVNPIINGLTITIVNAFRKISWIYVINPYEHFYLPIKLLLQWFFVVVNSFSYGMRQLIANLSETSRLLRLRGWFNPHVNKTLLMACLSINSLMWQLSVQSRS